MKTDIKERWLEALESGDFTQGSSRLINEADNSYCCLGVLCELAVRDGIIEKVPSRVGIPLTSNIGLYLPEEVALWAGIDSDWGASDSLQSYVAEINDADPYDDFVEVIKYIREKF